MPDRYGPSGVIALFIPLQNSNMQPEFEAMRPDGVSNQIYRFSMADPHKGPDAAVAAIADGLGCWPDLIAIGTSSEMHIPTPAEFSEYRARLQESIGDVPLVTATDAVIAALRTVGARRIAAISPMSDALSQVMADFYAAQGFEVPYHTGLQIGRSKDIIGIGADEARAAFRRLDHDDVDTFLHVGAALGIADAVADLERELGRPVISVNVATYWCALRTLGITDPLTGFGRLAETPGVGIESSRTRASG